MTDEQKRAKARDYYYKDHEASKKLAREIHHKRMASPAYIINMRMRNAIKKALRGQKAGRRWETLVGYTLAELIAHLERQMPKGLTMHDLGAGKVHIDHIVPKVLFDVSKPEELRAAWALPNLRPIKAEENWSKGSRRTHLL